MHLEVDSRSSNSDEGHHHHPISIHLMLHQEDLAQGSRLVSKQGNGIWPFKYVYQVHPLLALACPVISYWQLRNIFFQTHLNSVILVPLRYSWQANFSVRCSASGFTSLELSWRKHEVEESSLNIFHEVSFSMDASWLTVSQTVRARKGMIVLTWSSGSSILCTRLIGYFDFSTELIHVTGVGYLQCLKAITLLVSLHWITHLWYPSNAASFLCEELTKCSLPHG